MNLDFRLPDIGEGTAEAEITAWHVKLGDFVMEDQLLVDVMTDKATVEMTSPVTGKVQSIHGEVGQMVPVGSLLVVFELEGEDTGNADPLLAAVDSAADANQDEEQLQRVPQSGGTKVPVVTDTAAAIEPPFGGERTLASPAVRRAAFERGIPLQFIVGTGPNGRVKMADLDQSLSAPSRHQASRRSEEIQETKIVGLRRRIAEKLQESKRQIPHFGYVEEFDLTELEMLRADLNATRSPREPKLTLLPFFIRAVVQTLPDFPAINSRFDDAQGILRTYSAVHMGIAAQTSTGLMVPIIRNAERLSIWGCAEELQRITTAAKAGVATKEELSGSTITLTSLGALGGVSATPIINHPEVAIIGPNKLMERPVVHEGRIEIRKVMNVSSSFDHRIVDGHDAARFIQAVKRLIERPSLLFVERLK